MERSKKSDDDGKWFESATPVVGLLLLQPGRVFGSEADLASFDLHQETFDIAGMTVSACILLFYGACVFAGTLGISLRLRNQTVKPQAHASIIAVAAACLPIFFTGRRIARWEGALFLAYYAAYTAALVMLATSSDALPPFRLLMIGFIIPLTVVTLIVNAGSAASAQKRRVAAGGE